MAKYIILGNGTSWCKHSWDGVLNNDSYAFHKDNYSFIGKSLLNRYINISYYYKLKFKRLPILFIKFWRNNFLKKIEEHKDLEAIIIYDRNLLTTDEVLWRLIKLRFPNVKTIYLFSNIVKYSGAIEMNIFPFLKKRFDYIYAFDKIDAQKYNIRYHPLIYCANKIQNSIESDNCGIDIFYVGQAKDRYDTIISIYELAVKENLKCDFTIIGVDENLRKYSDYINYTNYLTYEEVLHKISNTKSILEIIQGDSTGLTIKTCEAVIYKKKLITNSPFIMNESFYNPNNILVVDDCYEFSLRNFIYSTPGKFPEEDVFLFSPDSLIQSINE